MKQVYTLKKGHHDQHFFTNSDRTQKDTRNQKRLRLKRKKNYFSFYTA